MLVGAGDFAEHLVVKVARLSVPLRKNLIGQRMGAGGGGGGTAGKTTEGINNLVWFNCLCSYVYTLEYILDSIIRITVLSS